MNNLKLNLISLDNSKKLVSTEIIILNQIIKIMGMISLLKIKKLKIQ
jgi:hypothetical protein